MASLSVARKISSLVSVLVPAIAVLLAAGCSSGGPVTEGGGGSATGGTTANGGTTGNGGTSTSGGTTGNGGSTAKGGTTGNGGTTTTGETTGNGGTTTTGGTSTTGGTPGKGGRQVMAEPPARAEPPAPARPLALAEPPARAEPPAPAGPLALAEPWVAVVSLPKAGPLAWVARLARVAHPAPAAKLAWVVRMPAAPPPTVAERPSTARRSLPCRRAARHTRGIVKAARATWHGRSGRIRAQELWSPSPIQLRSVQGGVILVITWAEWASNGGAPASHSKLTETFRHSSPRQSQEAPVVVGPISGSTDGPTTPALSGTSLMTPTAKCRPILGVVPI